MSADISKKIKIRKLESDDRQKFYLNDILLILKKNK